MRVRAPRYSASPSSVRGSFVVRISFCASSTVRRSRLTVLSACTFASGARAGARPYSEAGLGARLAFAAAAAAAAGLTGGGANSCGAWPACWCSRAGAARVADAAATSD